MLSTRISQKVFNKALIAVCGLSAAKREKAVNLCIILDKADSERTRLGELVPDGENSRTVSCLVVYLRSGLVPRDSKNNAENNKGTKVSTYVHMINDFHFIPSFFFEKRVTILTYTRLYQKQD